MLKRSKMSGQIHIAVIVLAVTLFIAITGCGGGAVGSFTNLGLPASAVINSGGGSLASGSSNLSVPANAVSTSTTFTLGAASGYPTDTRMLAGSAYTFDAGGAFLLQPLTLTISYSTLPVGAVETSLVMYTVVNSTTWRAVPGSAVNTTSKTVSASVQSAGTYAIFVTQTTSSRAPGTILFNRGLPTAANAMNTEFTDGTGVVPLISSAAATYVSNARYSPNGTSIVYDYTVGSAGSLIYTMSANGTSITKLYGGGLKPDSTNANAYNPSFSSDGSTIVFISDVTGTPEVYTMTSTGASVTEVTTLVNTAISRVFFTRAGKIAFYATVGGLTSWYQVNTDGTGLASVNSLPVNISLISPWTAYSPDGTKIATGYLQGTTYDLYAFSTDGSVRTKLTTLGASAVSNPHFTSDGTKIVFQATVSGVTSIFTVNSDGTNLANLTVSSGPDTMFDLH